MIAPSHRRRPVGFTVLLFNLNNNHNIPFPRKIDLFLFGQASQQLSNTFK
jgi:hypothetical protein